MQGRLAVSLNDDGTVTVRCDADAFFAHADEIRRLLTGNSEDEDERAEPEPFTALRAQHLPAAARAPRTRELSGKATELLVAGYYLTRERGFASFGRADLQRTIDSLSEKLRLEVSGGTLIHLARRGWLERVRRGAYRLSRRALDRVERLRAEDPVTPRPRSARPEPTLPSLAGLSRFLREVPTTRKWRRVLLVAYFLREHCGNEEFDQRLLAACFQRLRGIDAPGSLPALVSQVLYKRHDLLERGTRRGMYRLSAKALEELRRTPRIAQADAVHRARTLRAVAKTG